MAHPKETRINNEVAVYLHNILIWTETLGNLVNKSDNETSVTVSLLSFGNR